MKEIEKTQTYQENLTGVDPGQEIMRNIKKDMRFLKFHTRDHLWTFDELNDFIFKIEGSLDRIERLDDFDGEDISNLVVWIGLNEILNTLNEIIDNPDDEESGFRISFSDEQLAPVIAIIGLESLDEELPEYNRETVEKGFSELVKEVKEVDNSELSKNEARALIVRIGTFKSNLKDAGMEDDFKDKIAVLDKTKRAIEEHVENLGGLFGFLGSDEFELPEDVREDLDDLI